MLLTEARVLLLYDPTRGVDVGTKGEIFQLMRDLAAQGYAILFYSSDLPELVHVADRVARAARRARRGAARGRRGSARRPSCAPRCSTRPANDGRLGGPLAPTGAPARPRAVPRRLRDAGRDRAASTAACRRGVFTLDELNLDTAAAMTLILAATGQTIVLIRGGIDLSIGGMISLGTVIAATRFGDDPANVLALVAR